MFGYYDPASLKVSQAGAVINFINHENIDDVREIRVTSVDEASDLAQALEDQKKNKISHLDGKITTITGALVLGEKDRQHGALYTSADGRVPVPVHMLFDVDAASFPRKSIAAMLGVRSKGGFIAMRCAAKPLTPNPEPEPQANLAS